MNELIAKLNQQLQSIVARQEAALTAATAEGVSDDDRTKHYAEFDAAQAEKVGVKASLDRAKTVQAEKDLLAATPERAPIVSGVHDASRPTAGRGAIPAQCRRHGPLKAFKGANADERAYAAGLWVAATQYGHTPSREAYQANHEPIRATLSNTDNSRAAYFVPDVLDMAIVELTEQYGVFRRLAENVPMRSDTHLAPRWTTGMTAYWVGEGSAPTQSEPGWDMIQMVAKNLAAYGKMTRQLNEDALIDLGDKWAMAAAIAFAYAEDNAAFNGDGTSTYGGITGLFTKIIAAANAASLSTATGHTTLAALTLADYAAVVGKFPNYPGADPAWMCHKEVWANSMLPLQMAAGGATPADIENGGKPRFLGYDVEFVNVAPRAASVTTGVTGILFADLDLSSKFGDRRQRTLESGMINDDLIKQLMTLFAASRVDIVNHTIVDPKDSTKPGPVIGLKLG